MGNNHDSIALDWVRGEIQSTLAQGQQALESYVDNRKDAARLRFCLNYLHQVHGTLRMVELYGASLLTEEMEKLTQAILDNQVDSENEAVEVLMQAILQLPQYLDHIDRSSDDFPLVLLPLLNDLRAARGEALLSDTSLFKPDMSPARARGTIKDDRLQEPKVRDHVRKLRQMYQFALAGVVREADLDANFDYMQKVIKRLVRLCQKTPRGELWKAAAGFVETLQLKANPVNAAVKSLLRELDSEIRQLTENPDTALAHPAPKALFKNLLYYVARARELDSPRIEALRTDYKLAQALPSDDDVDAARSRVSGPNRDAIQSVVHALNEELAKLKDLLDLFVRADLRSNDELGDLVPGLQQVANTLAVIGLDVPRKVVNEQIDLVAQLVRQDQRVSDNTLMDIAGALLYVEASLANLGQDSQHEDTDQRDLLNPGSRELGDANGALLKESRNTLEQAKSAVVNFIASQWDTREIEHLPALLHSICGGLRLIPLERASDLLEAMERYITDVLLSGREVPNWQELDTLADAVTSIEYYLERLNDGIRDNDNVLRVAEISLESLGFPAGKAPTWRPKADINEADIPLVDAPLLDAPLPDAVSAPTLDTGVPPDELLDDEIVDIFIEEAEEVLATIHSYYPRLQRNHDDRAALAEMRRAYHTFKGSGRLVGASSLSELAWAVENLLNKLIDQTVKPNDDVFSLVSDANAHLPQLINEFRAGNPQGDVANLVARAEAITTTRRADTNTNTNTAINAPASATDRTDNPQSELIDDEILEVFIEEAGEVLASIDEYMPMLLRHYGDRSALGEVRRAFHTLKGSGRMVGADVIGELAWSVENLLNRVLDGSRSMSDAVASLLSDVIALLPALVSDFEQHRTATVDTHEAQARAHALADGKDVLTATGAVAASEAATGDVLQSPEAGPEPDDESDVDQLLLDIFESEALSHLKTVEAYIASAADKQTTAYTDELTRALHTLKGSAHTTGITPIADLVTPLERFVKDARAENKRCDRDAISLLEQGVLLLNQGLLQLHSQPLAELPGSREFLEQLEQLASATLKGASYDDTQLSSANSRSALLELFVNDDINIVLNASSILDSWIANPANGQALEQLRHELTLLTAATEIAGLDDIVTLSVALQGSYSVLANSDREPKPELQACLHLAHEQLINMMDQAAAGLTIDSADPLRQQLMDFTDDVLASDAFLAEFQQDEELNQHQKIDNEPAAAEIAFEAPVPPFAPDTDDDIDHEVLEIFQEEARELIDSTADALQRFSQDSGNHDLLRLLQRDLHTLKGGARLSKVGSIGDLAHELETLFEGLVQQQLVISPVLSDLLFSCHDRLASMVETLENGDSPRSAPDLIAEIQRYSSNAANAGADHSPVVLQPEPSPGAHDTNSVTTDPELMGIFLEEAYDLINATGSALHSWSENPENSMLAAELQRDVHTLKGGARMAGADAMGDLAHALEDLFERITRGELKPGPELYELLFACHDRLAAMVEQIATGKACPPAQELIAQVHQLHPPQKTEPSALDQKPATVEQNVEQEAALETPAPAPEQQMPSVAVPKPKPARAQTRKPLRTAQETIRVSAPLLNELVNLAGETSIARGRLEQQTSDFSHTLEEMTATIERLREQLRRMDIETETQILFRAEKELGPDYGEDFDPLEMDRYSSIQQLSRALSESSSDLIDLRQTLADRIRDTETLLVQQSRINTELQEGLMKTRMIPFASVVSRLRRIVRQISTELDKKANFEVYNAEGEMDRNVLERMIAPLEHMLRNALGHGVESPAERLAAGKAETGEISLSLQREGGDVVLRMRDDGAGISTKQVRNKAISQGLIGPNDVLTEREVLQLIMTPGFSTAKEVTQVSGRGVGMDVVASEIKQLGGSLDIHSSAGHGTTFTVRLPFTVSVNRALMVTSGDNFYAIPLNTIEGIVRVSAYELEEYYKPEAPLYEYAGQEYRLQYLGNLLNSEYQPKLQGQALPLPVILVRGAEQPMALQVDSLVGSREIVVKSLGPQFNSVRGVSGGTILGDGNVVVILDLPAMIRSDVLSEQQRASFKTDEPRQKPRLHQRATLVMVVDDSVTVRKVTSRLLERNGMEVITAKDGLDAVTQLQDYRPDIILLDIEMPRMDGFEVAGFVRHDDVLRNTPICMITSRTGEKHRERALAIGVNEYLGKPFQEATLLEAIRRLTGTQ
ncbi:Hpt domain-containing protein [Marinobacter psychrophilus]|uniref:Hpt domain-containing protein n=1 Tax=Marinobacter psychrophilus TaxID=330734 RepID=UPI001B5D724C|nr:Hpt domain-containing protein [Marinobacter psychrophilus]MBQ0764120.1 Hpt domain-containing protein [Marinobacter psychrophilus]MBQ0844900.1 Hpt domain-containing protein [Marinobacter psychrophilus]